ncbi:MAG: ASKHA domain-containing protein, partial [Ilumatobacteraceae bacterium]
TGPAFEGAQLSSGQRATHGSIERVRIDRDTLEPRFAVIGVDAWSDQEGYTDAVGPSGPSGICGSGVIDAIAEMYLAGVIDSNGVIDGSLAERTPRVVADGRTFSYVLHESAGHRIAITQNDVRAIQLAKAALRAGIDLLVEHAGRPEITDVRLAGAFGAHIDPLRALVLGLVPDCPVDRVRSVGNAAGTGAVQALLSRAMRAELEDTANEIVKIETATEGRFQELFVAAMGVPHSTDPTPHLAGSVELPPPSASSDPSGAGRGRRRSRGVPA